MALLARARNRLVQAILSSGSMSARMPYRQWCEQIVPHHIRNGWSPVHDEFAAVIDSTDRGTREFRVAPRESGKSTHFAKLGPLKAICDVSERYILLTGCTSGLAKENLAVIKTELTQNRALAERYPLAFGEGPKWTESEIWTRNGIRVKAVGRGGKSRGTTAGEHRVSLIVLDDLDQDPESVLTERARQKGWDYVTKTLIPMGQEQAMNVWGVGTPQHPDDIIGRVSRSPGWRFRKYQSIQSWPARMDLWETWNQLYAEDTWTNNLGTGSTSMKFWRENEAEMRAGASVLWPERHDLLYLMLFRARNGPAAFASEKQCETAISTQAEFPPHLFDGCRFKQWPRVSHRVVACDPSKGKSVRGDYSAIVWGGVAEDGLIYLDCSIERRNITDIVDEIIRVAVPFAPRVVVWEEDSYGAVSELFEQRNRETERPYIGDWRRSNDPAPKAVRIRRLTQAITSRRFRFRESPGCDRLLSQLGSWPLVDHDDGPDALEMLHRAIGVVMAEESRKESGETDPDTFELG